MENFIVSARKYRPITFDSVVGQQHITSTLKNAIRHNQLAQAFLFCGPRGVGKTTCARILAKTINCENLSENMEPCGECASCVSFQNGASFSIHELDAASNNSVDDIRNLIEQVRIPPQTGKYKIYIIDEVHMLSSAAFNAFLKTLEEPPAYAIFILATTEKHKILPTILSRCQIFDFNRIRVEDMSTHLAGIAQREGISFEKEGLDVIAQKADGGLRDALSMFDQIVSFSNKNVTYQAVIDNLNILDYDYYFKITQAIYEENPSEALLIFNDILNRGFEVSHFISGLASHFRNLLMSKERSTLKLLEVSEAVQEKYLQQSQRVSSGLLLSALNIANQAEISYKTSKNQRLQIELALLKMCHLAQAIQLANLPSPSSTPEEVKKKDSDIISTPRITENSASAKQEPERQVVASENIIPSKGAVVEQAKSSVPSPERPVSKGKWGKSSSISVVPNLNSIYEEKDKAADDDGVKLVDGAENQTFTVVKLMEEWNAFAHLQKKENKINLFTLMTAAEPLLQGQTIKVAVENLVQLDVLNQSKIDILNFLRVKLKNYSIQLEGVVMEQENAHKPYTSIEKYKVMVEKNPKLDVFRKTFDLGLS